MSHVNDMILTTSIMEEREGGKNGGVQRLNAFLMEHHTREFCRVDTHSGGDKGFQAAVYMVAINYLHVQNFLELFKECKWQMPSNVMLLHKGEHDEQFSVVVPKGVTVQVMA